MRPGGVARDLYLLAAERVRLQDDGFADELHSAVSEVVRTRFELEDEFRGVEAVWRFFGGRPEEVFVGGLQRIGEYYEVRGIDGNSVVYIRI